MLSAYAYTPGTARRILREGRGTFWAIENTEDGRSLIRLFSLLRVCQHFGITNTGWPVDLPAEAFRGLRKRRAAMYASWLSHREDKPISRQTITESTGLQRRRQQRYDVVAGIVKTENTPFRRVNGHLVPIMAEYEGKSRLYRTPERLPNTFATHLTHAPRGMTKRVNAALRRCCERGDATKIVRRYFKSGYQAAHAKNRATEAFVRLPQSPISFLRGTAWALV
jgi:hypothetical protein